MIGMDRRQFLAAAATSTALLRPGAGAAAEPHRVIVVGAGIMGASIAYHLARRGARVTILEQARPASGATRDSFAWINTYLKRPEPYYRLNLAGVMDWHRLALEIGPALKMQWGGSVAWSSTDDGAADLRRQVAQRNRFGDPIRLVDADELHRLLPGAALGAVSAGIFASIEGTLDPVQATAALLTAAQQLGARLIASCGVTALEMADGKVAALTTSRGRMTADHYVLAAGVGTSALARQAGIPVPLIERPGILAHSKPMPRVLDRVVVLPVGQGMGVKQNPDGRIVTGGHFGNSGELQPTAALGRTMLATAARHIPRLRDAQVEYMSLGRSVMPKDGLPIVGVGRQDANVFVAAMDSGVTLAALMGRLAGIELLDSVATDLLEPFRPWRFGTA